MYEIKETRSETSLQSLPKSYLAGCKRVCLFITEEGTMVRIKLRREGVISEINATKIHFEKYNCRQIAQHVSGV